MHVSGDSSEISIRLNGEPRNVPAGFDVAALVASLGLEKGRVAVEINRSIVPRAEWKRKLSPGDQIEVVAFVGGG